MLLTREEMTFDFGGARFDPEADRAVLGLNIVSLWAVRRLGGSMERRFATSSSAVMRQLPAFARAVASTHELRLRRMGLLDRSLAEMAVGRQLALVAEAHAGKLLGRAGSLLATPLRALGVLPRRRLTGVYLADPALLRPATPDPDAETTAR